MHRLLVAALATSDALLAAVVGLAAVGVPLTLMWVFSWGVDAAWMSLWPTAARLWQLGLLVPLQVHLDDTALIALSAPTDGAEFVLSLAPTALTLFVIAFAARSGRRAARGGAPLMGVGGGAVTTAVVATAILLSSNTPLVTVNPIFAVLTPTLVYAISALLGAGYEAWHGEGDGPLTRVIDRLADRPAPWGALVGHAALGASVMLCTLTAGAAVLLAVTIVLRGADMVSLFQRANLDVVGVVALALVLLALLPTAVVWTAAWSSGAGFAIGTGTSVTPAGTHLGVLPIFPGFALLPQDGSAWRLIIVLLPIGAGVVAGLLLRRRLADDDPSTSSMAYRTALVGAVTVLSAGGAALACWLTSGSIGPGRMAELGPAPGPVALAVGLEVLVGVGAVLLTSSARTMTSIGGRERETASVD